MTLGDDFAPNLICSDLATPLGEQGSLMATDRGDPLAIWAAIRAGKTRSSYAVPLADALPLLKKAVPPKNAAPKPNGAEPAQP